jgi:hypothetical protein
VRCEQYLGLLPVSLQARAKRKRIEIHFGKNAVAPIVAR